jgi:unsaturated rhamnogalacturonyl hydrolase
MTRLAQCSLPLLLLAAVGCGASNNSGGTTGGTSGAATGGTSGAATGGTSGAETGGTSGAATGGTTGAATGGTSGAATGGTTRGATGGPTGAATGGTTGDATGGTTRAATGGTTGAATGGTTGAATGGTTGAGTGGTTRTASGGTSGAASGGTSGGRGGSTTVTPGIDWSVKVTDSTIKNTSLNGWGYWNGFTLSAIYRVYLRTQNASYLQFIKSWGDAVVDASGNVTTTITSLDLVQPGLVLMLLYENTQTAKYQVGPKAIRTYLNTYPTTADGGFWHMTKGTGASSTLGVDQLWLDGTYMSTPFLMKYGTLFNDLATSSDLVAKQLTVYASHLKDSATGLLYHAYDEKGTATWADPVTHHSPEFWGRSMGWFGMALVDDLDTIPADHPQRDALLTLLKDLIAGLAKYQDASTGLWYQVVNKGTVAGNWLETSCSSMYTYIISKAVEKGYVDSTYLDVANKGYQGVLTQISLGTDGVTTSLKNICVGTDVGDYAYYIARTKATNDLHGLGAFLIMSEQMIKTASAH